MRASLSSHHSFDSLLSQEKCWELLCSCSSKPSSTGVLQLNERLLWRVSSTPDQVCSPQDMSGLALSSHRYRLSIAKWASGPLPPTVLWLSSITSSYWPLVLNLTYWNITFLGSLWLCLIKKGIIDHSCYKTWILNLDCLHTHPIPIAYQCLPQFLFSSSEKWDNSNPVALLWELHNEAYKSFIHKYLTTLLLCEHLLQYCELGSLALYSHFPYAFIFFLFLLCSFAYTPQSHQIDM